MSGPDQNDWENDPVWHFVDEAKSPDAGPFFVRNVMREVRVSQENSVPWWKQLLTPKPILAGSLAAITAIILITVKPGDPGQMTVEEPETPATEETQQLDALLEEEMLSQAAEDPTAFTDEALVTLLY